MAGIDTYAKLVLHNDDVSLVDSSLTPHTSTLVGSVTRSNAQSVFGGFSALFNGTTDYITFADSSDFSLSNSDFTLDARIYINSKAVWATTGATVAAQYDSTGNQKSWYLQLYNDGSNDVAAFSVSTNGAANVDKTVVWSPSINTWYHIAVVRSGNFLKFFIDGVQQGADADITGTTFFDSTAVLSVGAVHAGGAWTGFWDGYQDEFRFSVGIARWTANFTPPTSAYSVATVAKGGYRTLMGVGNGSGGSAPTSSFILSEDGFFILQEDGSSKILLEV